MALVFTDEELRQASSDILGFPAQIDLKAQQIAQAQAGKDQELARDNANKVFFDNFKTIVDSYHTELARSGGTQRTEYLESYLIDAAKQVLNNVHYPTSPTAWGNIIPKVADANLGLPTSTAPSYELLSITNFTTNLTLLKTGFTDGAVSDTLFDAYSAGTAHAVNGGFSIGQRVVISAEGVDVFGTVTNVGAGTIDYAQTLTISEFASSGSPGAGAAITNFFGGFSDSERESGSVAQPATFGYWRGLIDTAGTAWQSDLAAQITALGTLSVTATAEVAARNTALANAQAAKTVVDAWIAAPAFGTGVGRYGDTASAPMVSQASTRSAYIPTRGTEIAGFLGTVAQNPDGTYTASGQYGSLFRWVEFRASKGGGSLFNYYNFDLVLKFLQNQYDQLVARKAELDAVMRVEKLLQDSQEESLSVLIADRTNINSGDTIKLLDGIANSVVLTATISSLEQEAQVWRVHYTPATARNYTRDNVGRLVKALA